MINTYTRLWRVGRGSHVRDVGEVMRLQRPVGASAEGGASADDVRNTPYISYGNALSPVGPESLALPLGTGRARNSKINKKSS